MQSTQLIQLRKMHQAGIRDMGTGETEQFEPWQLAKRRQSIVTELSLRQVQEPEFLELRQMPQAEIRDSPASDAKVFQLGKVDELPQSGVRNG